MQGDCIQYLSFDKMEGKGFFIKEIEDVLLCNEIDVVVYFMKDFLINLLEGFCIIVVFYWENLVDWLVICKEKLDKVQDLWLLEKVVVGIFFVWCKVQILDFWLDVEIKDICGNVFIWFNKLWEGQFDVILLVVVGMICLKIEVEDLEILKFNFKEFILVFVQGVFVWQIWEEDKFICCLLKYIYEREIVELINIECKILNLFDGGCQMLLGVYCEKDLAGNYYVWVVFVDVWNVFLRWVQFFQSIKYQLVEWVVEVLYKFQVMFGMVLE